ncbi:hypothetical protein C8R45DRAFT_1209785 [Mycena sanguinolenta]|nr:hypothetical protein C8R45DRAFT_1209785 [Mycena sanguinolenta]
MKRVAEDIDRDSKRPKHYYHDGNSTAIFWDPIHEKTATDLLNWTPGESGYVRGQICMKWPVIQCKYRVKMEMSSLVDGKKQFEVAFYGVCGEELRRKGVEFTKGQELMLSLKGAVTQKAFAQDISLPVSLKYTDGVALAILAKGQDLDLMIDTWLQAPATQEPTGPSEPPSTANSDSFATLRQSTPPVRAPAESNLMDIDEKPAAAAVSPHAACKPVSDLSLPPKQADPLADIRNSLPINPPAPLISSHNPLSSSLAPSRSAHIIFPGIVHPPRFSTPKENPPYKGLLNESVSVYPIKFNRPPTVNGSHALNAKLPERTSAPVVETVRRADTRHPSESEPLADSVAALEPERILNKKQQKNLARKEKRKQNKTANSLPGVPVVHASTPAVVAPPTAASAVPAEAANPARTSAVHTKAATPARAFAVQTQTEAVTPDRTVSPITVHSQPSPSVPRPAPPSLSSSWPLVPHGFTPIKQLEAPGGRPNVYSFIGIVTFRTTLSESKTGDLTCSMRIVDPPICNESNRPEKEGILVNLFRRKFKEWLPTVNTGDVILLQDLKTSNQPVGATGYSATGYFDRFKWAVYDRTQRQFVDGFLAGVSESDARAAGYPPKFTPFYHTTDAHQAYCVALDEWWQGVEAKRLAALGTIHQIGAESSFISYRPVREHKLIEETRINEYFNCTVRVLHGHIHPNGRTYRLYVTDGTPLQGARPCHMSEIPLSLFDCVMPIEMWDDARQEGPNILANEYYLLRNVRLKRSNDGYAEGKMKEDKIYKLPRDAADQYPTLKALVERMQPYDAAVDPQQEKPAETLKQLQNLSL